ncbi:MAG TPA: RICIN domain-containing protein [Pseudobacteroides sp.]|uniref:RICIN domain-containing protein n=1 Tax=Pseudobacteroides sp. TaxID=1968840 RepID=UPI002F93138C
MYILKWPKSMSVIFVIWVVANTMGSTVAAPALNITAKGISNPSASQEVKKVYHYMTNLKGKGVLYTYYKIVNRKSGKLLDVKGGSGSNGANIIQWTDKNSYNQQWRFEKTRDGYYELVNRKSGLILEVSGKSGSNGASIIQWKDINSHNQQWEYINVEGEYFKLVNRNSGKYLEVSGGSKANGGKVIQWDDNEGMHQQWKLVRIQQVGKE